MRAIGEDGMNHIVATSGGKDSTALALRLLEIEPRHYQFVITPTGDELPPMQEHWEYLERLFLSPLMTVGKGLTLKQIVNHEGMIPNFRARFCTRMLKIIPFQEYVLAHRPCTIYVGLRADEEGRAGIEWDDPQITVRYPLREWGWDETAVWGYLHTANVTIPERTDCARCFYQTLYEWWLLWKTYPDIYQDAVEEEQRIGHTYRSPQRDTHAAELCKLREEFEQGYVPKPRKRAGGCRVCTL